MQDQLDITKMTKEQLEALAYRLVVQRTNIERNLTIVEQEIQKRDSEESKEEEKRDVEEDSEVSKG